MGINLTVKPSQPGTKRTRRHGEEAAAIHGAGSGEAAAGAFRRATAPDRDVLREQQLAALAQALGNAARIYGSGGFEKEKPGVVRDRSGKAAYETTPQPQGATFTPVNMAPRFIFVGGQMIPNPAYAPQMGPTGNPPGDY